MYDRCEVVIREDHVGGFFGNIGTCDPHRHADIRLFQGWSVINAIAGYGHNFAHFL
ncbi:hypothetical protein D3C76_1645090 [compost metagenome]